MNTLQLIKIQELNTDDQISNRGRVANYEVPESMVKCTPATSDWLVRVRHSKMAIRENKKSWTTGGSNA